MKKLLIETDYRRIVKEAMKLPEMDFYNYYLNIVEDNYRCNPSIGERLVSVASKWIQWYYYVTDNSIIKAGYPDSEPGQIFKEPEDTPIELRKKLAKLSFEDGTIRHRDYSFFKYQLDVLETIRYILHENILHKNIKPEKGKLTFKDLFINPDNSQKVKDLLAQNHYIKDGKWAANKALYYTHTENKTELLAAYYALKNKGILKTGRQTPQVRIFYNEFGLTTEGKEKYISERNFNPESESITIGHQEIFEKIFIKIK